MALDTLPARKTRKKSKVDPALRLGKMALDRELVTSREILRLRMASEKARALDLAIPPVDLLGHLGLASPAILSLLRAEAGVEDPELGEKSPADGFDRKLVPHIERALEEGRLFGRDAKEELGRAAGELEAIGVRLAPWQILLYRGEITAEKRIALAIAGVDRKRFSTRGADRAEAKLLEVKRTTKRLRPAPLLHPLACRPVAVIAGVVLVYFAAGGLLLGSKGDPVDPASQIAPAQADATPEPAPASLAAALESAAATRFEPPGGVAAQRAGDRTLFRLRSEMPVPDGAWVDVVVAYEGQVALSRRIRATAGQVDATVALEGGRVPAGTYRATFRYDPARQSPDVLAEAGAGAPGAFERELEIVVGTPEGASMEAREFADLVVSTAHGVREAAGALDAILARARSGEYDLARAASFLTKWRRDVEETLLAPLDLERSRRPVLPFPAAHRRSRELVLALVDLSREGSLRLHESQGAPTRPEDVRPAIEHDRDKAALEKSIESSLAWLDRFATLHGGRQLAVE